MLPDRSGVVTDGVKHSMNPFDEIALEEVCYIYIPLVGGEGGGDCFSVTDMAIASS